MSGLKTVFLLLAAGAVFYGIVAPLSRPGINLDLVTTGHNLSVMRFEVTENQWHICVIQGGCRYQPPLHSKGIKADFPVTEIGALDAFEFVAWAQKAIDPKLRLPTLEEWYGFSGVAPFRPKKLFTDPRLAWAATYGDNGNVDPALKPSGGFGSSIDGLADMLEMSGNGRQAALTTYPLIVALLFMRPAFMR